jgi:tRNA-2-methylthio-N6-dimethylallyladenosine synthase
MLNLNTNKFLKFYLKTYGCQMNEYDSARIVDALRAEFALELVADAEQADVIILNTCSVRDKAQHKLFSDLGRFRMFLKNNPELVIGVGGCVASQEGKNIIKNAPNVSFVFGPQTLHRLPFMLRKALAKQSSQVDISFPELEKFSCLPSPTASGPSAFVTIMEGCNKYCSYCIVPYTRGKEISRSFADVMAEVEHLVGQGVKEIYFLGQNVNDYEYGLAELITATAKIPEVLRIRFVTSYPSGIDADLIKVFASEPKLVSHIHLPVQSGSDRILERMRRRYTIAEYKAVVEKLRAVRPNISVSSDFIVGFPGENAEDFAATLELVKQIKFDISYSFIYSPRPGTTAAKLEDNISPTEKKNRLDNLQAELNQQAKNYSNAMLGTIQPVLVVGMAKKNSQQLTGRTENNRIVNFMGEKSMIGQVVPVRIDEVLRNSLRGTT